MDYQAIKNSGGPPGAPWICVFGTSDPADTESVEEAERLGYGLARRGSVVVTGGYGAAMEGANRGAKKAGGYSVGVTCSIFSRRPNGWIDRQIETHSLLERLDTLLHLGDGYIAGKGGTGTLAEIAVAWEYVNKRIISRRPLVLLGAFWERLPSIISDQAAAPGVSIGRAADSIITAAGVDEAVTLVLDGLKKPKPEMRI